ITDIPHQTNGGLTGRASDFVSKLLLKGWQTFLVILSHKITISLLEWRLRAVRRNPAASLADSADKSVITGFDGLKSGPLQWQLATDLRQYARRLCLVTDHWSSSDGSTSKQQPGPTLLDDSGLCPKSTAT